MTEKKKAAGKDEGMKISPFQAQFKAKMKNKKDANSAGKLLVIFILINLVFLSALLRQGFKTVLYDAKQKTEPVEEDE